MTNAERIRELTDEELVKLLVWRIMDWDNHVPSCDEGCMYEETRCALHCPRKRREQAVRDWLKKEV